MDLNLIDCVHSTTGAGNDHDAACPCSYCTQRQTLLGADVVCKNGCNFFSTTSTQISSMNTREKVLGLNGMQLKGTAVFSPLLPACTSHAVFNISTFNCPFHMTKTVELLGGLSSNEEEFNCKHTDNGQGQSGKMHVMRSG